MDDRCVICGAWVPEGRQVCLRCERCCDNTNNRICPECGSSLRLMDICKYITPDQFLYCKLYHCHTCHSDWESIGEDSKKEYRLHRKFWG